MNFANVFSLNLHLKFRNLYLHDTNIAAECIALNCYTAKYLIITKRNRHTESIIKIRNVIPRKCQMTQKLFGKFVDVEVCITFVILLPLFSFFL